MVIRTTLRLEDLSSFNPIVQDFDKFAPTDKEYNQFYEGFKKITKKSLNILALQINPAVMELIERFENPELIVGLRNAISLEEAPSKHLDLERKVRSFSSTVGEKEYISSHLNKYDLLKFFYSILKVAQTEVFFVDHESGLDLPVDKKSLKNTLYLELMDTRIGTSTSSKFKVNLSISKALNLLSSENPKVYLFLKDNGFISSFKAAVSNVSTTITLEKIGVVE